MKTSAKRLAAIVGSAAVVAASAAALPSTSADARESSEPTVLARHLVAPLSLAVNPRGVAHVSQNFGGPILKIRPGHPPTEVIGGPAEFGGLSRTPSSLTFTVTGEATPDRAAASVKRLEGGVVTRIGNLGRAETNRNPDGDAEYGFVGLNEECASQIDPETFGPVTHTGVIESHPYGTTRLDGTTYVADAAANVIWSATGDAPVRVLSVLPPLAGEVTEDVAAEFGLPDCTVGETVLNEPVPTDVETGPDGMLYVSTLAGEFPGAGAIFQIDPEDGTTTQVFGGLFAATGLAVARNGDMYVAMLFPNTILKIPAEGTPSEFASINQPAAVEVSHGYLYATVNVLAGLGFKQRQTPFAPRDLPRRDGPAGKLVRWSL